MRSHHINYLLVGGFTLLMVGALIAFILLLNGEMGGSDRYHAKFGSVHGIVTGSRVFYQGYPVGRVEEIVPMVEKGQTRFKVWFGVVRGWAIPKDSVVRVAPTGLLSAVAVQIIAGEDPVLLQPGEALDSRDPVNLVNMISALSEEFVRLSRSEDGLEDLLRRMNRSLEVVTRLLEGEGQALTGELLTISRTLSHHLPGVLRRLESASDNMEKITRGVERMTGEENQRHVGNFLRQMDNNSALVTQLLQELRGMRQEVGLMLTGVKDLTQGMSRMVAERRDELGQTLGDLHHIMESAAGRIDAISVNLENATHNFSEFSRTVREQPGVLLRGQAQEGREP